MGWHRLVKFRQVETVAKGDSIKSLLSGAGKDGTFFLLLQIHAPESAQALWQKQAQNNIVVVVIIMNFLWTVDLADSNRETDCNEIGWKFSPPKSYQLRNFNLSSDRFEVLCIFEAIIIMRSGHDTGSSSKRILASIFQSLSL